MMKIGDLKRSKIIFTAAFLSAIAFLTSCTSSSSPPGTKRVETWGTKTTTEGGAKKTSKTHSVNYEKLPEKGPELVFKGIWHIQDYTQASEGNRHCFLELFPAKIGDYNYQLKVTNKCPTDMRNIVAWRPVGDPVGNQLILVAKDGANIGIFDKVGKSLFRGTFTLTTGQLIQAHVKGW